MEQELPDVLKIDDGAVFQNPQFSAKMSSLTLSLRIDKKELLIVSIK